MIPARSHVLLLAALLGAVAAMAGCGVHRQAAARRMPRGFTLAASPAFEPLMDWMTLPPRLSSNGTVRGGAYGADRLLARLIVGRARRYIRSVPPRRRLRALYYYAFSAGLPPFNTYVQSCTLSHVQVYIALSLGSRGQRAGAVVGRISYEAAKKGKARSRVRLSVTGYRWGRAHWHRSGLGIGAGEVPVPAPTATEPR